MSYLEDPDDDFFAPEFDEWDNVCMECGAEVEECDCSLEAFDDD